MSRIENALERASKLRQYPSESKDKENRDQFQTAPKFPVSSFPCSSDRLSINNPLLVVVTDPTSHIAEEYQKLKAALIAQIRKDQFLNLIMITSAIPGEGKSITSSNLALSLAKEIDNTVLLIDADLRKPSVASYMGVTAELGLTDVLEGTAEVEDVLVHTGVGRLVIMPAGRVANNPVELFSSNRMLELLQDMKHRYPDRFIIIDTPPLLPFAETRTLARLVDGVVMVVKERLTPLASLAEAVSALDGARVLGIVYNEVEVTAANTHYGHYYSRYRTENSL